MIPGLNEVVQQLAVEKPGRDLILISEGISRKVHHDLSRLLQDKKKNDACTLFLTTRGGDPDGGYRIARCLQHHYTHIRLVIPSLCKSAGTLVAIGAHELVIGDLGELGPLDIQVRKGSELEERSSGLDIIQALEMAHMHVSQVFRSTLLDIRRGARLSTKLAGEFAASVATGVACPLYNQIDPNRLGEMQRAMRIAQEYGKRLNDGSGALKEGALDDLVASYPAHSFVIDRKEASQLFNNVQHPTTSEAELCRILWHVLGEQSNISPMFILEQPVNQGVRNVGINQDNGEQQPGKPNGKNHPANAVDPNEQGKRVRKNGVRKAKIPVPDAGDA